MKESGLALVSRLQATARALPDSGEKWAGHGMPVILLASPVGGSGRTTLAAHLAVEAGRTGNGPVLLLETAPAGALAVWLSQRANPTPEGHTVETPIRPPRLRELEQCGYGLCIIDTTSADPTALLQMTDVADLVLVPCPLDEQALNSATEFAMKVREAEGRAKVVVTRAAQGDPFWSDITHKLKSEGLLCPAVMHWDEMIGDAMAKGLAVGEIRGEGHGGSDVSQIWKTIIPALPQPPSRPHWVRAWGKPTGALKTGMKTILVAGRDAILATHLAVQAGRSGLGSKEVLLVGRDSTPPWSLWEKARGTHDPTFKIIKDRGLTEAIVQAGMAGFRLCIAEVDIDDLEQLAPGAGPINLVVVPVSPLRFLDKTEFERYLALASRPDAVFVLTEGDHTQLTDDVADALQDAGGRIAGKVGFDATNLKAWVGGMTVMESRPESRAARQVVELWAGIDKFINGM